MSDQPSKQEVHSIIRRGWRVIGTLLWPFILIGALFAFCVVIAVAMGPRVGACVLIAEAVALYAGARFVKAPREAMARIKSLQDDLVVTKPKGDV